MGTSRGPHAQGRMPALVPAEALSPERRNRRGAKSPRACPQLPLGMDRASAEPAGRCPNSLMEARSVGVTENVSSSGATWRVGVPILRRPPIRRAQTGRPRGAWAPSRGGTFRIASTFTDVLCFPEVVMPTCRKHNLATTVCTTCRGRGEVPQIGASTKCTRCKGTGQVCPKCGKDWKPFRLAGSMVSSLVPYGKRGVNRGAIPTPTND